MCVRERKIAWVYVCVRERMKKPCTKNDLLAPLNECGYIEVDKALREEKKRKDRGRDREKECVSEWKRERES